MNKIPDDCRLPDSIEEIERGREKPNQLKLIDDDNSVMAKLRRIKADEQTHTKGLVSDDF